MKIFILNDNHYGLPLSIQRRWEVTLERRKETEEGGFEKAFYFSNEVSSQDTLGPEMKSLKRMIYFINQASTRVKAAEVRNRLFWQPVRNNCKPDRVRITVVCSPSLQLSCWERSRGAQQKILITKVPSIAIHFIPLLSLFPTSLCPPLSPLPPLVGIEFSFLWHQNELI